MANDSAVQSYINLDEDSYSGLINQLVNEVTQLHPDYPPERIKAVTGKGADLDPSIPTVIGAAAYKSAKAGLNYIGNLISGGTDPEIDAPHTVPPQHVSAADDLAKDRIVAGKS